MFQTTCMTREAANSMRKVDKVVSPPTSSLISIYSELPVRAFRYKPGACPFFFFPSSLFSSPSSLFSSPSSHPSIFLQLKLRFPRPLTHSFSFISLIHSLSSIFPEHTRSHICNHGSETVKAQRGSYPVAIGSTTTSSSDQASSQRERICHGRRESPSTIRQHVS